jgi:hypothetical protein
MVDHEDMTGKAFHLVLREKDQRHRPLLDRILRRHVRFWVARRRCWSPACTRHHHGHHHERKHGCFLSSGFAIAIDVM